MSFRRKLDDNTSFDRPWKEYEDGFGDQENTSFWLGLKHVYKLTNAGTPVTLRIEMLGCDRKYKIAVYPNFKV